MSSAERITSAHRYFETHLGGLRYLSEAVWNGIPGKTPVYSQLPSSRLRDTLLGLGVGHATPGTG
jgi:hypothetical protein